MFDAVSKAKLIEMLMVHEGYRQYPYKDTVGILTIGYGHQVTAKDTIPPEGWSKEKAKQVLIDDLDSKIAILPRFFPTYKTLDQVRSAVIANMAFNMGIGGLMQFRNTLELIKDGKYRDASFAMLKSKWATQVGVRANILSEMMRTGEWPK